MLRVGTLVLLVGAALALLAAPAAADPAGPSSFRATITATSPQVDGFEAEILGGDAFLQLRLDAGHTAEVPGYDGDERYLRFDADGRVYINQRSRTFFLNGARYGGELPVGVEVGADAPPDWQLVSADGTFAWHDHRVHWMSPVSLPPAIDASRGEPQAYDWPEPIPVVVDGTPVALSGELRWYPEASPAPVVVAALGGLAAALAVGWRRPIIGIVLGIAVPAVVALTAAVPANVGLPAGLVSQPLQVLLPAVALGALAVGHLMRDRSAGAVPLASAGGAPLVVWALTLGSAASAPVLPTEPAILLRLAVGLAAGGGLAAALLGIRVIFAPAVAAAPAAPAGGAPQP